LRKLLVMMLVTATLIYVAMIAKASASPSPTEIWATDAYGVIKNTFNLGEKIHIKAHSDTTPYTVILDDPSWTPIHTWLSSSPDFDSGEVTDGTNKAGKWTMTADNKVAAPATQWMVVRIFYVIPDAAIFGVLGIVAACFAAFGIQAVRVQGKP
jgi:hypothetical protein